MWLELLGSAFGLDVVSEVTNLFGTLITLGCPFNSKKTAKISLLAKPHVIDWVQILKVKI